jgi:hypothetical protein
MKYVPSLIGVGQLSGKSGNNVASRNRFGSYFRTRVNGTNPQTALQTTARNTLATYSSNYRNLTAAQRTAWEDLGAQIARVNTLGQTYTLTGLMAYVSVNRNLVTIGGTPTATAPSISGVPASLVTATVTATAT